MRLHSAQAEDHGVRDMLKFLLVRDTMHQKSRSPKSRSWAPGDPRLHGTPPMPLPPVSG